MAGPWWETLLDMVSPPGLGLVNALSLDSQHALQPPWTPELASAQASPFPHPYPFSSQGLAGSDRCPSLHWVSPSSSAETPGPAHTTEAEAPWG